MGMRQWEAMILQEARKVTGSRKLRQRDIMEWSTGKIKENVHERRFWLPENRVNIAVLAEAVPSD